MRKRKKVDGNFSPLSFLNRPRPLGIQNFEQNCRKDLKQDHNPHTQRIYQPNDEKMANRKKKKKEKKKKKKKKKKDKNEQANDREFAFSWPCRISTTSVQQVMRTVAAKSREVRRWM
jgi:hypothetical protein